MRVKGSGLGSWFLGGKTVLGEVEEEKTANKTKDGHYLILKVFITVVNKHHKYCISLKIQSNFTNAVPHKGLVIAYRICFILERLLNPFSIS